MTFTLSWAKENWSFKVPPLIYFPVSGIGLGHAARSVEVARQLVKRGFEVTFSSWGDAVRYIRSSGFDCLDVPGFDFAWRGPSLDVARSLAVGSLKAPSTIGKQIAVEAKIIDELSPAVVLSDSRAAPLLAARLLGVRSFLICNQLLVFVPREKRFLNFSRLVDAGSFSILGKIWALAEAIYVPDLPPPYTISLYNIEPFLERLRSKLHFTGPLVAPRDADPEYARSVSKLLASSGPTILFAISGPRCEREKFVKRIVADIAPLLAKDFRVIVSAGDPSGSDEPIDSGGFVFISWARSRSALMKLSDVVVTRGGLTTITEAIALRKPLIVVPTLGQSEQYGNARRVEEAGFGRFLDQRDLSAEAVAKLALDLLQNRTIKKTLEDASALLSSLGGANAVAEDICERLSHG